LLKQDILAETGAPDRDEPVLVAARFRIREQGL